MGEFLMQAKCEPRACLGNARLATGLLGLVLSFFSVGCQPTKNADSSGAAEGSSPSAGSPPKSGVDGTPGSPEEAKRLIEESFAMYRRWDRYEDAAQLILEAPGTPKVVSPFRVALERPNRLAIAVHSVQGCWSSTTWEAICAGDGNPFPRQRMVRPLPNRMDLDWILKDNLGGLFADPVGLPIQLELLLAATGESVFGDGQTQVAFLERDSAEGRACDRVRLEKNGLRWIFWIDREDRLIRRLELPPQLFYPGQSTEALAGIHCEIQFQGAVADRAIDWSRWQIPNRTEDAWVRRFVMPPPIASTNVLGTTVEAFDLKDAAGTLLLDAAESTRPNTILCWVDDQPMSEAFVRELIQTQRALVDREIANRVQIFLIGSDDAVALPEALKRWNCDLPLAVDRDGTTQSTFQITGTPSLVILDRERRIQVSEFIASPSVALAIPDLVARIDAKEDLASRQLQQDADNQARYIAALHRVALDKRETSKLEPIREFQFALHGMRRDWRVPLSNPSISAGGAWYPTMATGTSTPTNYPFVGNARSVVMASVDELGQVHVVDELGSMRVIGRIEPDQADGAERIHTAIDPWSHQWLAIVPEGLPRFWMLPIRPAGSESDALGISATPPLATTYNTQDMETPVALAWTAIGQEPVLTIATSASRVLVFNPKTEQRLEASGEPSIAIAPGIDALGSVAEWSAVVCDGQLTRIRTLAGAAGSLTDTPIDVRLDRLTFEPKPGMWLWGRHGNDAITLSLAGLPSGETGVVVCNMAHEPLHSRPITVLPEQSRLLSAARLPDGTLYGLAYGPNRILHLFTADLRMMDQVSFNARILSASLFVSGSDLKLVVALEDEVSAWSLDVPDRKESVLSSATVDGENRAPNKNLPAQ